MVDKAWQAHCNRECITDSTQASKKDWYEAVLKKNFGVTSSNALNPKNDFDKAMALFEEIADEGIYWQMQFIQGSAKRARYRLDQTVELLRLTEDYVVGIARQMGLDKPLRQCTAKELVNLRISLLYYVRRKQERTLAAPPG